MVRDSVRIALPCGSTQSKVAASEPIFLPLFRSPIVLKKIGDLKSGKKMGSLAATFDWVDPQGKAILTESRTIVFYSNPTMRMMDFDINLRALEKVKFGDTKEGTFAIRLAAGL